MPDDKKKIRPLDAKLINIHEPHEIKYWTQALGISKEQLVKAVQDVGTSAEAVKRKLAR